jgi:hypothetical protein
MINCYTSRQEVTKLFDDPITAVIDAFERQRSYVTMPITVGVTLRF